MPLVPHAHPASNATLAIIAGGRSRRLGGVPKGLLRFNGREILAALVELGGPFADVLLVADDPSPYRSFGLRAVADVVRDRGAPGGVHAALFHARTPWVFAVGCDMPFVTATVVNEVLSARDEELDAAAFEVNGRLEPLCSVYRAGLADSWGLALQAEPSFRSLLRGFRARILAEERLRALDPSGRALLSINSPEDLSRWGGLLPVGFAGPP